MCRNILLTLILLGHALIAYALEISGESTVLVINISGDTVASKVDVLAGEDALLLYIPSEEIAEVPLFTIEDISMLVNLDPDKDGTIDKTDSLYRQLYLGWLDTQTEELKYASLEQAGIAALVFQIDADRIITGDAIMVDSSRWSIEAVKMETCYLESVLTQPIQQVPIKLDTLDN